MGGLVRARMSWGGTKGVAKDGRPLFGEVMVSRFDHPAKVEQRSY